MSQDKTNTNSDGVHLDDSVSSLTQTINQGMGAVGDTAADIEIYMGEQSNEMAKGVGNVMSGMGNAMQQATDTVKEQLKGGDDKKEKEESK